MTTALFYAPALKHDLHGHPEHAGRVAGVWQLLNDVGVIDRLSLGEARRATVTELERVHTPEHIATVNWLASRGGGSIGGDTYVTAQSYDAARLASGAGICAVDAVLSGTASNAISLVRPPGHHAGASTIEGFCLFNSIAVMARHAQAVHGLKRIAIIDFDVHHGNGTQDIFYGDGTVHFTSLHMFSPYFYPGSGGMNEDGTQSGLGKTVNVPLPQGVGDVGYQRAMEEIVEPLVAQFAPELILVSAGFDGHWRDPLAEMALSLTGYAEIGQRLVALADSLCDGRIVCLLEGGYDIPVLGHGVLNLIRAMQGDKTVVDPFGISAEPETDISELIVKLQHFHLLA